MAQPGIGFRTCWSLMMEMSFHLLEAFVATNLLSAVAAPGTVTIQVASLGVPLPAVYNGVQLVINDANAEVITLSGFNPLVSPPTVTATFLNTHNVGAQLIGATFPTQAIAGDPFFTQSEILNYIARAQNELLARVPLYFLLSIQEILYGQIIQSTVCNPIEINRVAISAPNVTLTSLTRAANVVTGVSVSPHNLAAAQKFSILSAPDSSYNGAFRVATVPSPTTFTYPQDGANSTTAGGTLGLWVRLYETTQEMLSQTNPGWQNRFLGIPTSFFEDRVASYQFGVNGKPSSNFPVELLCSIRDSDSLTLLDGFLVPDLCLHFVKYKALEYAWQKDGEARNPQLAKYCETRFNKGVLALQRWMDHMVQAQAVGMANAGRGRR